MADEKPEKKIMIMLRQEFGRDLSEILNAFLNEEIGNRVTINNMQGLIFRIQKAFETNKVKDG